MEQGSGGRKLGAGRELGAGQGAGSSEIRKSEVREWRRAGDAYGEITENLESWKAKSETTGHGQQDDRTTGPVGRKRS